MVRVNDIYMVYIYYVFIEMLGFMIYGFVFCFNWEIILGLEIWSFVYGEEKKRCLLCSKGKVL